MLGAAELGQRVRDPDVTRPLFERIVTSGRRMERMIDQLLDVTRIRMAGGLELQREPADLAAICRAAIDELQGARGHAAIALEAVGAATGDWDADRLAQLVSNLIGNAVEHAPRAEGGTVAVAVAVDGMDASAVTLRVHNAGTIPEAVMPVLFEPFRRAPTTRRTAGLGLGLFITQQIAQAHGGRVQADSDPQRGTTFVVVLPRAAPAAAADAPPPALPRFGASGDEARERFVRDASTGPEGERAALSSEQRLRAIFDASPYGIVVIGPDKVFRAVSCAYAAMVGYEPEDLVGRTYAVITHPDDLDHNVQLTDEYFADERATGYALEKRYLHRDGRTLWVRVTARSFVDADTGARLVLGIVEDITSRRQLDQARRDSERMLAAIWDCVVLIGADWRYRFVNGRAATMLGAFSAELVGRSVWERPPGAPDARLAAVMREVMAGAHAGPVPIEERVPATDRWYESTISRCDDGILVVWRDVTERKQAELTLRRALELRDEFISVTSHELRTPLTALVLHLESLGRDLDRRAAPELIQVRILGALRQGERLAALVEELLDGSRLASGPLALALSSFDARDLVQDVAERMRPRAAQSGCALNLRLGPPAIGAWDRAQLDRALYHLVGNALKYGPRAPVDIEVHACDDAVEIAVRDRGIGVTEEDRARIFGRFERAVPHSHYGGLGLGLYIASQIVESHGGTIAVDSVPGEGAAFVMRLPRRSATLAGSIA